MASIEKRNRNGRSRWYVRYRDPAGRQRTKVFDRKIDAERYRGTSTGSRRVQRTRPNNLTAGNARGFPRAPV